ncbi:MAG: hypothetical protein O2875_07650 [Planctomycetota bacterium]|nr:hypothetical protein [Planctomycetota bacterium]
MPSPTAASSARVRPADSVAVAFAAATAAAVGFVPACGFTSLVFAFPPEPPPDAAA